MLRPRRVSTSSGKKSVSHLCSRFALSLFELKPLNLGDMSRGENLCEKLWESVKSCKKEHEKVTSKHVRHKQRTSRVVPANQTKERSVHELFAGRRFEPKFDGNCACFPSENTRIHKKGEIHELLDLALFFGRGEKTPTPKTRFSVWTLLRTPGRFTTRPLPVHFTTKVSVVRPFSVLSKDEIGPHSKTGRFLSKAEILGVCPHMLSRLLICICDITCVNGLGFCATGLIGFLDSHIGRIRRPNSYFSHPLVLLWCLVPLYGLADTP